MPKPAPALLDPANYPFHTHVRTRFGDLDPNRHINNVAIISFFETGRLEFIRSLDLKWVKDSLTMVVAIYTDYLAETNFPGDIAIHVGTLELGRSSWTLGTLAVQDGIPGAFCRATLAGVHDGKAMPLDDAWRTALDAARIRGMESGA